MPFWNLDAADGEPAGTPEGVLLLLLNKGDEALEGGEETFGEDLGEEGLLDIMWVNVVLRCPLGLMPVALKKNKTKEAVL